MFDVSARPCVSPDLLTLSIPWPRFAPLIEYMDESFLITESWSRVQARMRGTPTGEVASKE